MTPSLEGLPNKAKEAPSLHEVRLARLDTKPVFQCLREDIGFPHRHRLLGQTTKQSLSNFESRKP